MGQKVNPIGIRLGVIKLHKSIWYADKKEYAKNLHADIRLRAKLTELLKHASVSLIQIDMLAKTATVTIHTARPGLVIGKKGDDIAKLRTICEKELNRSTHVNVREIAKPDLDAKLVAQSIANQLEKRVMFRRAMKRALQNAMRAGAQGIKIKLSGRLGGAEIARSELQKEGRIPLHTFRADIDYATHSALTTYGIIGVSVWIFKGEIYDGMESAEKVRWRQ